MEIKKAIKHLNNGKAAGPAGILSEAIEKMVGKIWEMNRMSYHITEKKVTCSNLITDLIETYKIQVKFGKVRNSQELHNYTIPTIYGI